MTPSEHITNNTYLVSGKRGWSRRGSVIRIAPRWPNRLGQPIYPLYPDSDSEEQTT